MATVAQAVGVRAPSLYKRYADRDALLARVRRDVYAMLREALLAVPENVQGAARIRAMALAYRAFALTHPRLYSMLFHSGEDADAGLARARLETIAPVLATLAAAVGSERALAAARALTAYLHGHLSMRLAGAFASRGDGRRRVRLRAGPPHRGAAHGRLAVQHNGRFCATPTRRGKRAGVGATFSRMRIRRSPPSSRSSRNRAPSIGAASSTARRSAGASAPRCNSARPPMRRNGSVSSATLGRGPDRPRRRGRELLAVTRVVCQRLSASGRDRARETQLAQRAFQERGLLRHGLDQQELDPGRECERNPRQPPAGTDVDERAGHLVP